MKIARNGEPSAAPANGDALPLGSRLQRKGHGLETVSSRSTRLTLLSGGQGTEVVEVVLDAGGRLQFEVDAVEAGQATETYYLLEGEVELRSDHGTVRLTPGDQVVTEGLAEVVILTAPHGARLLYVTSKPFFHLISGTVRTLMELAVEVERRDGYTAEHCLRLQRLSNATALELGLGIMQQHRLNYGAYLHDLGKVKVPAEILQKPGALDEAEWAVIHRHPTFGREMLEGTYLNTAAVVVEQHHERLDGSGYPYGLSGDAILVESAIVAVADTFDAMTTDRPYRKALAHEIAYAELERFAGVHYPKDVVAAFRAAASRVEGSDERVA